VVFHLPEGITVREVLRRIVSESAEDDVLGRAAQMAYYFLLAVFPFFLVLATVLGFMADAGATVLNQALAHIGQVAPPSAYDLVLKTVRSTAAGAGADKLSFGIVGTVWAASMAVSASIDTLNTAYEIDETRPWWRLQLLAIALTVVLGAFFTVALLLLSYGGQLLGFIAGQIGVREVWVAVWRIAQVPVSIGIVLFAFMIIYRYGPNLSDQGWGRTLPGSIVATIAWVLVSIGLRVYLHFFNTYSATYGSLGGAIILLLWFYLTAAAILIGGEVNSELEKAAAGARGSH